jgi:HAD superfamily phosphoserine phosphatase-like hydrolase
MWFKMVQIVAFDLDRTLFRGNSSFQFASYLYERNLLSLRKFLFIYLLTIGHLVGFLSIQKVHQLAFDHIFKGLPEPLVKEWVGQFLESHFDQLVYTPAVNKLKEAQAAEHLTIILSSSPEFLVEPIAMRFKCKLWYSTKYGVDKDLRFCNILQLMQGEEKARIIKQICLQHGSLKEEVTAFSDSHLDLPFLLAAGNAIGVNPNIKLRFYCHRYGWPII